MITQKDKIINRIKEKKKKKLYENTKKKTKIGHTYTNS